jgi:hypothetical protein
VLHYTLPEAGIYLLKLVPDGTEEGISYTPLFVSPYQLLTLPVSYTERELIAVNRMSGKPLAGVEIATYVRGDKENYRPYQVWKTDASGSVAQQAYQQQMGALNDALPSLYRLALDTYNSEGDDVVTRIDQLNTQEKNAQAQYNAELSDYYSQLDRKGNAYNAAYEQDYGRYQDYLGRLDTLYGYYSNQEQQAIAKRQQTFNNVLSILGVIGDAVQLAITGTTGIGSLMGTLANTGYNMYAKDRAYAAERADAAWDQQMQETQRQDSLAQQKYKNEQAERQYQDTLRQQEFNNNVTSEKLNIAKGEWALKQSKAAQRAQQAAANAGAKSAGSSGGSGSGSVLSSGGSTIVPYSAARLYRQGRSDTAIRSELLKEGYSNDEVANILKQLGS